MLKLNVFISILLCLLPLSGAAVADESLSEPPPWQSIIRNLPYRHSAGMADNLNTIRRWVLLERGYCETSARHILFDQRGRFLGWMDNQPSSEQTQTALNELRAELVRRGQVHRWIEGTERLPGYPWAFSCDQPHVDVELALDRLFGRRSEDLLWGTWDGMQAGTEEAPVALAAVVELVYQQRQSQLKDPINIPIPMMLAQLVVESGAVKQAASNADAVGILQLTPQALADCELAERFHRHRMAQVDCAVRLYVINQRNLIPVFEQRFGHLPRDKQQRLFNLLLLQSYHSGIGAISELLNEGEQGAAALYFAEHAEDFSADDIATGLIYHNLGRPPWGWASLYYVRDVLLLAEQLCRQPELADDPFCQSPD